MQYASVDQDTFTQTGDAPVITFSITELQQEIATLQSRIAQETSNFQASVISPLNAEIAGKQALLAQAQSLGMAVDATTLAVQPVDATTAISPEVALQANVAV